MIKSSITLLFLALLSMIINDRTYGQSSMAEDKLPVFSFGIITDSHYAEIDSSGSRFYRESLWKISEALESFKKDSVEFVINLGDLIDNDFKSYKPVIDLLDKSDLPVYHCLGNHDFSIKDNKKKKIPMDIPGEGYYSFQKMGFRFIFLNGNEISVYAPTKKRELETAEKYLNELVDKEAINAEEWNGAISVNQLEWLMEELDEARIENEKVFIFCHFPVFPLDRYSLLNQTEVLLAISNYDNIIAWFAGHNHSGNYGNYNRTHHITLKGMVETINTNSYTRVDVYNNKIWLNGKGLEKSMILAY